jgi:hypothetical protein
MEYRWSDDLAVVQTVHDIHRDYNKAIRRLEDEARELALQAGRLRLDAEIQLETVTGEPQPISAGRLESALNSYAGSGEGGT